VAAGINTCQKNGQIKNKKCVHARAHTHTHTHKHKHIVCHNPSKHAESHQILISLESLARSGLMIIAHQLASRQDPFDQNLTVSQNQAGFAQHDSDHLWKNATKSASGKLAVGQFVFCQNQAQ